MDLLNDNMIDIFPLIWNDIPYADKFCLALVSTQFYVKYCEWTEKQLILDQQFSITQGKRNLVIVSQENLQLKAQACCVEDSSLNWKLNFLETIRSDNKCGQVLGFVEITENPLSYRGYVSIINTKLVIRGTTDDFSCYGNPIDMGKYNRLATIFDPFVEELQVVHKQFPLTDDWTDLSEICSVKMWSFQHKPSMLYCPLERYYCEIESLSYLVRLYDDKSLLNDKFLSKKYN